jgi:hypothetical protein
MDDSERSYGYSEDIYHGGRHGKDAEKSYEYGPENQGGETEGRELSPEEEAIHIEGPVREEPVPTAEEGGYEYDYGREGGTDGAEVESFTWDLEPEEAHASGGTAGEESSKSGKR